MRCQPGDICIVTNAPAAVADVIGRVVQVRSLVLVQTGHWAWELAEPQSVIMRDHVRAANGRLFFRGDRAVLLSAFDNWLRPLRDSEGQDEMLRVAGLPRTAHIA